MNRKHLFSGFLRVSINGAAVCVLAVMMWTFDAGAEGAIRKSSVVPGVFGSHPIPIRNFPVSRRWAGVYREIQDCASAAPCGGMAIGRISGTPGRTSFAAMLREINANVNQSLRYRRDALVHGQIDYWASPSETLRNGAGDCEDFVFLKMAALHRLGVAPASMSLVVLQIRTKEVFHAVLSVTTDQGTFILDNLSDDVALDTEFSDYMPLYSLSADRAWIHGRKLGGTRVAGTRRPAAAIAPGEHIGG